MKTARILRGDTIQIGTVTRPIRPEGHRAARIVSAGGY
jgi:hypothetical protein